MVAQFYGCGQSIIAVGGHGKVALHILSDRKKCQETLQEESKARHSAKNTPPLDCFLQRPHLLPFTAFQYAMIL